MPNYTFTPTSCYALSTHDVTFSATKLIIKLTSTGETVYQKSYDTGGIAIMCQTNDFCVGTLVDNGVFTKTIDYSNKKANMWLVEASGQNKFIGSDNESDAGIYNKYILNDCPVRIVSASSTSVLLECPCQSSGGTCSNDCYTYG
ncbi:MAG: hypothetical protein K9G46_06900 [Flavobacteriales bacterium]|jgi:monomeric isocitrate dehydrogenase|nr:hypothetical protein [Flavobacteriales bacterium]